MNDNYFSEKEREQYRKSDNNRVFAVVLILVGAAMLVSTVTDYSVQNWWAFFMLIPAGAMLLSIWREYQEDGRLSRRGSGTIIPATIILTMVAIFLFNLSWAIFWPATLVAVGLSVLLGSQD